MEENITPGKEGNFKKRNTFEVDYHGEEYDYASIMHYGLTAFSSNNKPTLKIVNTAEYNSQGKPTVGQRLRLSESDTIQINRLYNCRGSGIPGILKVYIRNGQGLPDTDGIFAGDPDPYVKVSAVDDRRQRTTHNTRHVKGDRSPAWNQWLDFGGRISWQYFEMSVWDDDPGPDGRMTNTQTFSVSPGFHSNLQHCNTVDCSIRIYFSYYLRLDGNECRPNPCLNGGRCTDLIAAYKCICRPGYSGTWCQYVTGRLRIYARYGKDLPDKDGLLSGDSDPYIEVIAYDRDGNSKRLRTKQDKGDESPEWNQWLDFGVDNWSRFTVRIWDEDFGSDDSLSAPTTYYLSSYITRKLVKKNANSGYVYFDYYFEWQASSFLSIT